MSDHAGDLGAIAQRWFDVLRGCGDDVRELLHDGHPTACIADAAFAYVNAFKAYASVGFFYGAMLRDPAGLMEGFKNIGTEEATLLVVLGAPEVGEVTYSNKGAEASA